MVATNTRDRTIWMAKTIYIAELAHYAITARATAAVIATLDAGAVRHTATSVWHTGPTWEVTNIAANTVTARTAAAVIATFATRAVGNATAILQTILSGVQHAIATNRDRRSEYYAGAVTRVTVIEIAVITLLARVVNPVATNRKHAIPTTSR